MEMSCEKCVFSNFVGKTAYEGKEKNMFECRRYPPQMFMKDESLIVEFVKIAYSDDDNKCWCGEFSQKLLKENL